MAHGDVLSFTCSLVTQGENRFYSLSIPSKVLADTCFVTTREESQEEGFQRMLNQKRAKDIARYLDEGGAIPTAIVLSAQRECDFTYNSNLRTLSFRHIPNAFKVIDGQHRLWGFKLSNTDVRVPVIVFSDLTVSQEARLFLDVNTKQKPVPAQLVLDIRKLAKYKEDLATQINLVFDLFATETDSALLGLTSNYKKVRGKIDRVTFTAGLKPAIEAFDTVDTTKVYRYVNAYLAATKEVLAIVDENLAITQPIIFRAFLMAFADVTQYLLASNAALDAQTYRGVLEPVRSIGGESLKKANSVKVLSKKIVELTRPKRKIS